MRLDLFLKITRLCLRRSIAQRLCDAGLVSVNGRVAKSSHAIKSGDEIEMRIRNRKLKIHVNEIPGTHSVSKADAAKHYTIVDEQFFEQD